MYNINKKFGYVDNCNIFISCTILLNTRKIGFQTGGPSYEVELGRLDGRISTKASVTNHLPHPEYKLAKLTKMFASHGLTLTDLIALSGISFI